MKNTPVGGDAHIDPKNKFYKKSLQQGENHYSRADVGIRPYSNGITLIALIITIIVLLILAGISLNLINSGDGIIIQARWSEFVAEYTKLDEQKELYVAGKQMDKLSEEFSKANWKSLFTNISYAAEVPETMYPVDLNQPFSIWDTADTLKNTICYVEKMQYSELFDKSKVDLYRVDMSLLPNVEVRRSYIINIVSGMLYYIDGEPYKGLIYHTPRYGVAPQKEDPEPEPPTPEQSTFFLDANGGAFDAVNVGNNVQTAYDLLTTSKLEVARDDGDFYDTELLIKPQLAGYKCVGWYTSDGQVKYVGDVYDKAQVPNNTLYAHYEAIPEKDLTIHYLPDGADTGFTAPSYTQTVPASASHSVTLDACRFSRSNGYQFLGWGHAIKTGAGTPYKTGGYYDVANVLIKVLGEDWEDGIIDIVESYEDVQDEPAGEDDGEGVTDDEPEPTVAEQRREDILDYFVGYETEIQTLFSDSSMTLNGLADWLVTQKTYLQDLQNYEDNQSANNVSTTLLVDYYDQQSGIDMSGQDLWLEALWTDEYTITLDATGGDLGGGLGRMTTTISVGDNYGTVLTTPTKAGSVFEGWFTAPTGGTQITGGMYFQPTDPRILYAHWAVDGVDITYDANTGMLTDDDGNLVSTLTEAKVRGALFGTMPEPFKIGYVFKGWFTQSTGGTLVQESDVVTGPMTLYAQWEQSDFVKLDLQGGEIYRSGYWKAIGLYKKWEPAQIWTLSGQQYSGITPKEGMPIGQQARGPYISWGTRGWKLPTGNCKYWCTAGGTAYRGVRKEMYGTRLNGTRYPKQVKFVGWYSQPNGQGNLVGPRDIWHDSVLDNVNDRVLYAAWDEALTITYEANGGYFGKPSRNVTKKQFYNKWEGKKYPKVARPKRDGYRFLGWYDAPTGGNKIELGKRTCLIQKSKTTVYAHWEKMDFTINVFDLKENGWSQSTTPVNGDFSTCTIKYKWSTKPKGTRGATVHTTRNTTVTNRQPGKTYYVWAVAISKNREKFFSDVKTVLLQYAPLAFNVNISSSSVGKNGWTQNCSATLGSLSGYKVAYVIEEVNASTGVTNSTAPATVNSDAPTNIISVSGKKEGNQGVKYKVWARATKGTNVVRSTNYVMVQTSHPEHYGDPSSGGDCYKDYNTTCTNNTYYYVVGDSSHAVNTIVRSKCTQNRFCSIDASNVNGYYINVFKYNNGSKVQGVFSCPMRVICSVCGAVASVSSNSNGGMYVCDSHYNSSSWQCGTFSKSIGGTNYNYTSCAYTGPVNWSGTIYRPQSKSYKATVSHVGVYNLTCSGLVNGSATSVNF